MVAAGVLAIPGGRFVHSYDAVKLNRKSEKTRILWSQPICCKSFYINWLPRMDSNHDKVIQSHLSRLIRRGVNMHFL